MVTNRSPELVVQQLEASDRRKRSIDPELLDRLVRQDQRLFDLLVRHRAGEPVTEAIVAELLPAADAKATRLNPVRIYGRDDLRQELVTELLYVAGRLPLKRPAFLTRRLVLQATRRLTRRLEREWYRQLDEWYRDLESRSARTLGEDDPEDEG